MFSILDGRSNFYQWDLNRKLIVNDNTIKEVHFCNRTDNCSLIVETYEENGMTLANVPNILLQDNWDINVYAYDGEYTKHSAVFEVKKRTRPADYVYVETEALSWEDVCEKIDELYSMEWVIGTDNIEDKAINADKIQAGAITQPKIKDDAITEGKIRDGSVTNSKIADDSIGTTKIRNNCISNEKIKTGAVGTTKLGAGAVTAEKIADSAITTAKLADSAIGTTKLANYAVTNNKLATGSVNSANIIDGAISANKIQLKAVTVNKLADDVLELINNSGGSSTYTGTTISTGGNYELYPSALVNEYVVATPNAVNFIVLRTNGYFNSGDSFIINTLCVSATDGMNIRNESGTQQLVLNAGCIYKVSVFNYWDWEYNASNIDSYIQVDEVFNINNVNAVMTLEEDIPVEEVATE